MAEIIKLNVGGVLYTTTRSTLTTYPDSMLGAMFSGSMPTTLDDNGNYFIDRDGNMFIYILNFLRSAKLALPDDFRMLEQLSLEADFYQIEPLINVIENYRPKSKPDSPRIMLSVHYYDNYGPLKFTSKLYVLKFLQKRFPARVDNIDADNETIAWFRLCEEDVQSIYLPYDVMDYLHVNGGQLLSENQRPGSEGYEQTWLMPESFVKDN